MKTAKTAKNDIAGESIYYTQRKRVLDRLVLKPRTMDGTRNNGRDPDMGHCLGHHNTL